MSGTQPQNEAESTPIADQASRPHLPLPGVAVAFFFLSPVLLFLGGITFLSTESRDYFTHAATQCAVGIVLFLTGLLLLLTATVIACMRRIAWQQVEILLLGRAGS